MKLTSFPKDKIKILLLEGVSRSAVKNFNSEGYKNIEYLKGAMNEEELSKAIKDVHILGIRSKTQITKKIINAADKLVAVGCFCIGTNQVDLASATSNGVAVFNSPFSNTRSVAELVIAFSILLIRKIPAKNQSLHDGVWLKDSRQSFELRGKTIGIIGYGHIGSQVSVLAESLGLKVQYHDIEPKLPLGNANSVKSLKEILKTSDIVSLHVPGTPETKNMIDAKMLALMKKSAILLNLSRGDVVDIDALADALKKKKINGAAVDVFPVEPKTKGADFFSPLQNIPNVILTPHIGGSTEEAQHNIGLDASQKLIRYLDSGSTVGSHTVPPLNLPANDKTHRILHIHKNVPGVLSQINSRLSKSKINILGQFLNTNDKIGYVVFDVEQKASKKALQEMRKVSNTIKSRILY
ncbi:MAG: phosphoglycerate dehydrogenase [Chitinophagales bacterium]|nr:phosphoglycerate dehydrogenase [Chitinophagales bacterium]